MYKKCKTLASSERHLESSYILIMTSEKMEAMTTKEMKKLAERMFLGKLEN